MLFVGDASAGPGGHLLEFDRADAVYEQAFSPSDQRLHERVVEYRFWTA